MKLRFLPFLCFLISFSCAPTVKMIPEPHPLVRAKIITTSPALLKILDQYQSRLDVALQKAETNNKSFKAVLSQDKITHTDYEIIAQIDSITLVSEEYQKQKLGVKDSVYNALQKRQEHFDSTNKPVTREQDASATLTGSIAATVALTLIGAPFGVIGGVAMLTSDDYPSRPNLTFSESQVLKKSLLKPKVKGMLKTIRLSSNEEIWKQPFFIEDSYDRFISYDEQIDMLVRSIIGRMRFTYTTPFLFEKQ